MGTTGPGVPSRAPRAQSRRVTRWLTVIAIAGGLLSIAVVARAYWSLDGSGAGGAGVGSLAAPSGVGVSSTPGTTTALVSWTGATAPDGGSVDGYYVQRSAGGVTSPACASSPAAPLGPGAVSCTDLNVPDGTYTYTVTAVFRSWTSDSAASAPVPITALASFTVTAPASATALTPFSITVTAKDQSNQTIMGYTGTVHVVTSDPNGSVPADYTFVAGDAGSHTFTNAVTLATAASQTVTVNDVADATKTGSATVTVSAGAAAQLAYTRQPGGGTAGVAWATQPKVAIQDAAGNTVTTSSASVTLAITAGTGTPGAVLTCSVNPKAASSGVATFAGCKINLPGTGYTLTATATSLASTVSAPLDVVVGPPTKLAYVQQPTAVVAGTSIAPPVTVAVQDANGNVVTSSTATITIAIGTNPGGGTLSGTTSVSATSGVATFADLSIDRSGTGYKLAASSTGLTGATSSSFNVTAGTAVQLQFTQQPSGGTGGVGWTTQPKVTVQDTFGNTVTSSTASVTLAITNGTGTPGATLTCTANPKAASSGVATFAACKINQSGTGYTLTATAAGLTSDVSAAFDVAVGPAAKVVYTQQPSNAVAGSTIAPAVALVVQDAGGNTVTSSTASVTIAISTNPGGGTLSGTLSVNASGGTVSFNDLWINKSGTGYKLTASSTGLTSATSSTFNVTVGTAAQLGFTQQPGGGTAGSAWSTQPKVAIQDAYGNTVTTASANVTLAITPGTGTVGAVLTCTANPKATSSGVATFAGCKINLAGGGYTLTATAPGLTATVSGAFSIT
jgi:trimeric autotransporter adhesin